jgi:hypothetical protein
MLTDYTDEQVKLIICTVFSGNENKLMLRKFRLIKGGNRLVRLRRTFNVLKMVDQVN